MAKPFDEATFPGKAVGKGNAQVIQDDFDPSTNPPVDVSDPSNVSPVVPITETPDDSSTGLPTIPAGKLLANSGLTDEDFPGDVPDDVLGILF